jgi:hypothetical protein
MKNVRCAFGIALNIKMSPLKQRRYLKGIVFASFGLWALVSFGPMALWYFKGDMSPPTANQMSPTLCLYYWQLWKDSAFMNAPTLGFGYFIIGMVLLRHVLITKNER